MTTMTPFVALVRKDLALYFANRRALIMSIAAPILIAAFFGSLFGNNDNKPAHIEIALTDLDRSEVSKEIVASLRADSMLTVVDATGDPADAMVKAGKLPVAVTLPPGFGAAAGRALFGGSAQKPELLLRYDPSQSMALQVVRGLLAQYVMQNVSRSVFSGQSVVLADLRAQALGTPKLPEQRRRDLLEMFDSIARVQDATVASVAGGAAASGAASASAASPPARSGIGLTVPYLTREQEAGPKMEVKYNSYAHSFAGMGVQFVLLLGVDLGVSLLTMRRMGLWKRLRAAPLSRGVLLGSRIASGALIALFSLVVTYAAAMAVFGVRIEGSVIGFVAVLVAFALMTASFGLLIAAIGKTPEATRGLAILVTLLMVMLGGAWIPSFIFPAWLQKITLFVPTRWAVDGLDAMSWRGLPLNAALPPVLVMGGFAAAFAVLAVARFDWEE
jgi:ABC-2 type transport system permease protein